MAKPRPCGCKGYRTCLICETQYDAERYKFQVPINKENAYVYCPLCNKAWKGWDMNIYQEHPNHNGSSILYPGVFIKLDFLSSEEEDSTMKCIDEIPWDISQSGRRKQNFGPKTNFKKRKIVPGPFEGFPKYSEFIQRRFNEIDLLQNYETIEQCSLEYDPVRGASIDPHIDDCWIWGERIVTVNFLSDSTLTMTPYHGSANKYNLIDADTYYPVVNLDGSINKSKFNGPSCLSACRPIETSDFIVRIPMPRRSLLILYGEARYHWEHCVLREDITQRRVCLAYREFTPPYLDRGQFEDVGSFIRKKAKQFWDHKIKYDVQ
ncbi:Alpha-ketoglutarate-dependent dioxygenase alkB homolog 4 [Eumeta japonica]|uniref:Alpha-ketoglutarate-dependent dioxygenase alkB homolog 4 n=1 Tax=Eumeta variegata TaxID=151549 RepID=A0A4C1UIB4_EUMVA|nr:Alpha-ketoglutarate-dependent dioxygenase alkB homolog 4 [Eumeta japonica]